MPIFRILGGNSSSSTSRSSNFMGNTNSNSNRNSTNTNNGSSSSSNQPQQQQTPRSVSSNQNTYPGLRLQRPPSGTANSNTSSNSSNLRTSSTTSFGAGGGGGGLFSSMRSSTSSSNTTPYVNNTPSSSTNRITRASSARPTIRTPYVDSNTSNSNSNSNRSINTPITPTSTNNNAASRPGAYAVTRSTAGMSSQVYRVTVPPGVIQGNEFTVHAGNRRVRVRCPLSSRPGHSLQITLPPEPITSHRHLNSAPLTTACSIENNDNNNNNISSSSGGEGTEYAFPDQSGGASGGGAFPMTPEVRTVNRNAANTGKTAQTFLVTIPPNVYPGMQFTVNANGQRFMVTCPPDAGPNRKVRIVPPPATTPTPTQPPPEEEPCAAPKTQVFEVVVPSGVRPNQPFTLMANGQRVLVTCPPNVVPGQKIRFQLPVPPGLTGSGTGGDNKKQTPNIQLSYKDDSGSSGWCRTIRVTDMKFQWVRVDSNEDNNKNSDEKKINPTSSTSTTTTKMNDLFNLFDGKSNAPQDNVLEEEESMGAKAVEDMDSFDFSKAAYVRKIQYLEGNDARMRTGSVTLVPAQDAVVESKVVDHNYHGTQQTKTLLSYTDIANVQTKSLDEKIEWLNKSVYEELYTPWEKGHVKIVVRRHSLLMDSVDAVMALGRDDMRKRWRIEFLGEPGIEAGGLTREWFQLVTEQIFDPDFGLWLSSNNNQMSMTINAASHVSCPDDHLIYFRFLGRVMGRALFDRQLIKGHMVRHLYKHLLGWPVTFADLEAQDEEYYNALKKFTTMEDLSVMCLDFTITEETLGVRNDVELIPGGNMKEVTSENISQYLEANLKYRMLNRCKPQITELMLGFFDIIPEPALTVLNPNELELILCGLPKIDMDDWIDNTKYSGYYESKGRRDQVVQWFWDVVQNDFDQEMKARLLQFVTGTSGVPPRGFAVLQGNDGNIKKFCVHGCSRDQYVYPRAHTCFNRIDLPNYSSKEELHEKLGQAVSMTYVGFDME